MSDKLRVATYNILSPFYAVQWGDQAGLNDSSKQCTPVDLKLSTMDPNDDDAWRVHSNWESTRCFDVAENIKLADIVCLQEVSSETLKKLEQLLPDYAIANVAYHANIRPNSFGTAIVYKKDRLILKKSFQLDYGTLKNRRSASCGIFDFNEHVIQVVSIHLKGYYSGEADHTKKQQSKKNGYNELLTYVKGVHDGDMKGIDVIVIAGDFNEDPCEKDLPLYRPGLLQSYSYTSDNNLDATEPAKNRRIDWLFCHQLNHHQGMKLSNMELEKNQKPASDHLMTGSFIEFGEIV